MNQRSEHNWTDYDAIGVAEGFVAAESPIEEVEAWAYIIENQLWRELQGWFGRNAHAIIKTGLIDSSGNIDWNLFNEEQ